MNCEELQNDSLDWLSCDDPTISTTSFCQNLQENFFDIEVLDEQDNKIQQFQGSQQGTTIQNLEPGTYTVNEIVYPIPPPNPLTLNQLSEGDEYNERICVEQGGFPNGGVMPTSEVFFDICFEYEDEQGNDCGTIALAAGEEKTCIVKNYIKLAQPQF